uniref:Nucleoside-diphosphate kinase n=1 Tax=Electrophorus electricus TaxID=8005 RepID=A0A4W4FS25_ELEEL
MASRLNDAHDNPLADNLIETEAETEFLLEKPSCFIITGKPVSYFRPSNPLSALLATGQSIPEEKVAMLVLEKLNSPEVENYGYVLSCWPSMSEEYLSIHEQIELVRNLKLAPDIIINVKCPDGDLRKRLAGQRQHPQTGRVFLREEWHPGNNETDKARSETEDEVGEEEEVWPDSMERIDLELQKDMIGHLVRVKENFPEEAYHRILDYKDTLLRPLEDFMADHDPQYLFELDGNKDPEELFLVRESCPAQPGLMPPEETVIDTDTELLRALSSFNTVVPGFRWGRSRWGRTCPVALKEGKNIKGQGICSFIIRYVLFCSTSFLDKMYVLSSQDALEKFMMSPRQYLLPPMPCPPCRVSVIGPPCSGTSTLSALLAEHYGTVLIDMKKIMEPVLMKVRQGMLEEVRQDVTTTAMEKVQMELDLACGPGEMSRGAVFTANAGQPAHDAMRCMSLLCCVAVETKVTEDHPDVRALVDEAMREAEQASPDLPEDLWVDVLQRRLAEVRPVEHVLSTVQRHLRVVPDCAMHYQQSVSRTCVGCVRLRLRMQV